MAAPTVLVTDYAWPNLHPEEQALAQFGGRVVVAASGDEEELIALAPQADAILTNWRRVTPAVLDAARRCVVVSRYGIGLDNIAVGHATSLGIIVTNVPTFCLDEVSDHTMALLLSCARRTVTFARATASGAWSIQVGRPLPRLRGQTLGLIGYGAIARAVVPKARGFGLRVMAYTPRLPADALDDVGGTATNDLAALLAASDYVSLHLPVTPETRGLIGAGELRQMRPGAFLINTSRGALIDEDALRQALVEGWIAGAALDVLTIEPPPADHPLLGLPNVIVTPHAAFYSETAIADLQEQAIKHVVQALRGQVPDNVVNPVVLADRHLRLARQ